MTADNLDILERRYFNAIFDNRTTIGCRALHGKTWLLTDNTHPVIPRHFNCRSSWLLLLKGQKEPSGTRAAIGGKGTERAAEKYENRSNATDKKVRYRGKRDADMFSPGQIQADTAMGAWLRQQPDWYIRDTLGETRAKLFLDGKLPLTSFADAAGRRLTLAELAARDAEAFTRAGLPKP